MESYAIAARIALMVLRSHFSSKTLVGDYVVLLPDNKPVAESEVVERLARLAASFAPVPLRCASRVIDSVLAVECAEMESQADALHHREIADVALADMKARHGTRPDGPEVLVVFRGSQLHVRWDDIGTYARSFAGDAIGGSVVAANQYDPTLDSSIRAVFQPCPAAIAVPKASAPGKNE